MSFALHAGRGPFLLEKWYVDTLLPDGGVLILHLGRARLLGFALARLTVTFFDADGAVRGGSARVCAVEGGASWLRFGPAWIEGERLAWKTPGLSGELRFRPRHRAVEPRSPFLEERGRRLLWAVEIPDADVTGELEWPGGEREIAGRGYRDRVFLDLPPWRFPIRELVWGRAAAGDHAAFWVQAATPRETIAVRWEDGQVAPGATPPVLRDSRVLVEAAVAELPGLRLGPLRPLLRRLSGDPRELKWSAAARLHRVDGRAVHERVTWR